MPRTTLSLLIALSLAASQPLTAVAANIGRVGKIGRAQAGVPGFAGLQTNISLAPLNARTLTLGPTLDAAAPAPRAAAPERIQPTAAAADDAGMGRDAILPTAAPTLNENAETIRIDARRPIAGRPVRAPQARAPPAAPKVRFDRRNPARGVYAEPGKFGALKKRVLEYAAKHWELPIEEILAEHDALLVGESHASRSSVLAVSENLGRLKAAGVRVVGIEGLKRPDQARVDAYLAGKTDVVPDVFPSRKGEYSELLTRAKAAGIRVKALGLPLHIWAEVVRQQAAKATGDPAESFPLELGEQLARAERTYEAGFNETVAEVVLRDRNRYMARELAKETAPGEKVVAIVGGAHTAHPKEIEYRLFGLDLRAYGSLAEELAAEAKKAFSLTLTGGLFVRAGADRDHAALLGPLHELAAEASVGAQAFFRTSADTAIFHVGGAQTQGRTKADGHTVGVDGVEAPKGKRGLFYGVFFAALAAVFAPQLWGSVPGGVVIFAGVAAGAPLALYVLGRGAITTGASLWRTSRRLTLGAVAAAAGAGYFWKPILVWLGGLPFYALYALPIAALGAAAAVVVYRRLRGIAGHKRAPLSARRLVVGALLGLLLGAAPHALRPAAVPVVHGAFNSGPIELSYERAPRELDDALISYFERSASGRELLSHYRDAAGTVRLPLFYMVGAGDPHYVSLYDSVFMPSELKDVADWNAYIEKHATTWYHELWHGVQARRAFAAAPSHYEHEQEAYLRQNLHLFDVWSRDISALDGNQLENSDFADFARDPQNYLRQALGAYGDIGHVPAGGAVYDILARWKAEEMPRLQIEALLISGDRLAFYNGRFPYRDQAARQYRLARGKAAVLGDVELMRKVEARINAALMRDQALIPRFDALGAG